MTTNNTPNIFSKTQRISVIGKYSATSVTLKEMEEGLYIVPKTWVFASKRITDDEGNVIYERVYQERKPEPKKSGQKRQSAPKTTVVEVSFN